MQEPLEAKQTPLFMKVMKWVVMLLLFWGLFGIYLKILCASHDFHNVNPTDGYFAVAVRSNPLGSLSLANYNDVKATCSKSKQCTLFFDQLDLERSLSKLSDVRVENLGDGSKTIIITPNDSPFAYRYTVSVDNSTRNFGRKDCLPEEFIKAFLGVIATALLIHFVVLLRNKIAG